MAEPTPRVLMLHDYYRQRGGEDVSAETEARMLRDAGVEVELLTEHSDRAASMGAARVAGRAIWSTESYGVVSERLSQGSFDLVHVQNFFPLLSPSVYYAARARGVPVVQSLRNYRIISPGATLYRGGRICEASLGRKVPWPCVLHGCYRDSRAASAAVASMISVHRAAGTWRKAVTAYIALSEFSRQKFIEGGLPADRLFVKPNAVHPDPGPGDGSGGFALFVGRLSAEKGIDTMLRAWKGLGGRIPLRIVGTGPKEDVVGAAASTLEGVSWLGGQGLAEVYALMQRALFVVFPSEWYEPFGRVVAEAFACGTPVVAADLGGVAEMVRDARAGVLFRAGDAEDLARTVGSLLERPRALLDMRQRARKHFQRNYGVERNLHSLIEIYRAALGPAPT